MKEWRQLASKTDLRWSFQLHKGFPGGLAKKNQPAVQETMVQHLGQEDPLEKGMAACSSILTWRIPWTEKPARLPSVGLQGVRHD